MFITKKNLVAVLARELAINQLEFNRWSGNYSDTGYEMCNNYANRMKSILQVSYVFGVQNKVIEKSDEMVKRVNAEGGIEEN